MKDTTPENLDDKRVRTYSLTEKGREIVPKVASRVQKIVLFVEDCCPSGCCSVDSSLNLKKNVNEISFDLKTSFRNTGMNTTL